MKKVYTLLIAIFMCFALAACAGDNGTGSSDDSAAQARSDNSNAHNANNDNELPPSNTGGQGATSTEKPSGSFDAKSIAENLVVHQYSYSSTWSTYVFHVIENTSEFTLEIAGSIKTYDSSGNLIGAKSSSQEAVGAGQRTILWYMLDEDFSNSEYEISVSEEKFFKPVTQNLTYTSSRATDKEIITVTNNGDIAAQFVEVHVLFFNENTLVNHARTYFTDNDFEIKPGKSITEELRCRNTYDSIVVVFTGRGR
jgi:hypothetical protein